MAISRDPSIGRFVEKQMRNWEISRAQHYEAVTEPEFADFITLSNIVGAGGSDVAQELGQELRWPVFDRELLIRMAQDNQALASLYHSMDERDLGWLEMILRPLVEGNLTKNDYFHRLIQAVLRIARKGPAIFVGRSVDLVLPRDRGMRVELVASMDYCVRNFAERNRVSVEQARAEIDRIESERRDFVRHHFHIDKNDPTRFDLQINIERFTSPQIVRMLLVAHAERLALATVP